jgi:UDP-N-acetylmuramate dehydrogenase
LIATSERTLIANVELAKGAGEPVLVLGGGSNIVVADDGPAGLTVNVQTCGVRRERAHPDHIRIHAAAGESWDELVALCVADGLSGIEALSGIPGTVGASPMQNVGAYGQEVAHSILKVRAYDRLRRELTVLSRRQCRFSYRSSLFREHPNRYLILSVTFQLRRSPISNPLHHSELCAELGILAGGVAPLAEVREAVLGLRRRKGMILDPEDHDTWSVGSFFKNPRLDPGTFGQLPHRLRKRLEAGSVLHDRRPGGQIVLPAAWLIEQAGFPKGYPLESDPRSPVSISEKHALALTNRGSASTGQLVSLAREVRDGVDLAFGVLLEPEPILVGVELAQAGTTALK